MGNIEIRQQSNPSRRTQIFTQTKSRTPFKISQRGAFTQRSQQNQTYSPIRYAKKSLIKYNEPLTERKVNTDRVERYNEKQNQYEITLSPYNQDDENYLKTNTMNSKTSKFTKIKSLQTENFQQKPQQPINSFSLTGKIVSNSRRVNQQRKAIQQMMNSTIKKDFNIEKHNNFESPYDNREIIKKVRNFNDFLNQIKRKLKQDKQQNLLRNRYRPQTFNTIQIPRKNIEQNFHKKQSTHINEQDSKQQQNFQKTRSTRKIEVALKLQNQKLQLQKYRKLVERQLSKTHSIENISLCTKNSGQKILTIQYQSILPYNILSIQNSKSSLKPQTLEPSLIQKLNSLQPQFNEGLSDLSKEKHKSDDKMLQKAKQREMVNKLKSEYEKIKRNMMELGKLIQKYEKGIQDNQEQKSKQKILIKDDESLIDTFQKLSQSGNSMQGLQFSNLLRQNALNKIEKQKTIDVNPQNKMEKIDGLFSRLYSLQNECQETDRQIREAIENSNSQSLLQESFRQKFSSFAPSQGQQIKQ